MAFFYSTIEGADIDLDIIVWWLLSLEIWWALLPKTEPTNESLCTYVPFPAPGTPLQTPETGLLSQAEAKLNLLDFLGAGVLMMIGHRKYREWNGNTIAYNAVLVQFVSRFVGYDPVKPYIVCTYVFRGSNLADRSVLASEDIFNRV